MKIAVLDAKTLGDDIDINIFDGEVTAYDTTPCELVEERIKDADVVIVNKIKLNKSNLENAKNLKLICVAATGYDNIDTEYCGIRGIAV